MNVSYRICRVVSSYDEAELFVKFYNMRLKKEFTLFPIYCDRVKENWLVISGHGKQISSFAAIYLKNCSNSKSNTSWLNFGFGYKKNLKVSKLFFIDEIFELNSKKKLYPSIININFFYRTAIYTVPTYKNYLSIFQDLDSYYFYKTVSKFSNQELLAVLKVSSNLKEKDNITLRYKLIKDNFNKILKMESTLKKYSKLEGSYLNKPLYYDEITNLYHFTVSQKNELVTLLRMWNNFNFYNLFNKIKKLNNSKVVLDFLRKEIKRVN